MRQQIVGVVNYETVDDDSEENDDRLIEGSNDVGHRRAAPCHRTNNGTNHRNVHTGFGPRNNDPSSRFYNIQQGFASLEALTRAIGESISNPRPRGMIDIARDVQQVSNMRANATTDDERAVYTTIIQQLNEELAQFVRN